jgi:hypothetical protein
LQASADLSPNVIPQDGRIEPRETNINAAQEKGERYDVTFCLEGGEGRGGLVLQVSRGAGALPGSNPEELGGRLDGSWGKHPNVFFVEGLGDFVGALVRGARILICAG